jgi:hypothetical protein
VSQAKSAEVRVDRAVKLMENVKRLTPGKEKNGEIFKGGGGPSAAVKPVKRKSVIRFEDL